MAWEDWVPVVTAVIAVGGLALGGDIATKAGRIRRNVEKDIAIRDKLSDGMAKTNLSKQIDSRLHELYHRERGQPTATLYLLAYTVGLAVVGVGLIAPELRSAPDKEVPQLIPLILSALSGLAVALATYSYRRQYVWLRRHIGATEAITHPGSCGDYARADARRNARRENPTARRRVELRHSH